MKINSLNKNIYNSSFRGCFVTLSKQNNGDYTKKEVVEKFNDTFIEKEKLENNELAESVNFFIPAAGAGTRFKIARLLGNYNKINMPIKIGEGLNIHFLDFIMMMSKPFIGNNGVETIIEPQAEGSFSGVIRHYLEGNPVKDTVVCGGDSVFGYNEKEMKDIFGKAVSDKNTHILIMGAIRPPETVEGRYGVLDVCDVDGKKGLKDFIEKPCFEIAKKYTVNGQNLVNTGFYYLSKESMENLLEEIKSGKNNIKKNDKEKYDFALVVQYILSQLDNWFGKPKQEQATVIIPKDAAGAGEAEGFYQFAKMVQEGKFLGNFSEQSAELIKKSFRERFHLEEEQPYINFSDSKNLTKKQIGEAPVVDGVKIIA